MAVLVVFVSAASAAEPGPPNVGATQSNSSATGAIQLSVGFNPLYPAAVTTVSASGLTRGSSYTLWSDALTIQQPSIVSRYPLEDWQATVPADIAPGTGIRVWITSTADPATRLAQLSTTVAAPFLYAPNISPWGPIDLLGGFSAGETVDLTYSFPIGGPATVIASSSTALIEAKFFPPKPGATPTSVTITATGRTHHLTASFTLGFAMAVLHAGQSVNNRLWGLATTSIGYSVSVSGSVIIVHKWRRWPDGQLTSTIVWSSPNLRGSPADPGTLLMRTDGNLVLSSRQGVSWSSGTDRSGSTNYAVMQMNGDLVVYTGQNVPVWSSQANGLVYATTARIASSRIGTTVYIKGLIYISNPKTGVRRAAGRRSFLQRYISGHWQTILARTTNSTGQIAVGFVQTRAYPYRWATLATTNATYAASLPTTR